jgi:hypothetical protein
MPWRAVSFEHDGLCPSLAMRSEWTLDALAQRAESNHRPRDPQYPAIDFVDSCGNWYCWVSAFAARAMGIGCSNRRSASAVSYAPFRPHDTTRTFSSNQHDAERRRGLLRISSGLIDRGPDGHTILIFCTISGAAAVARASTCPRSTGRSFPIFCGGSPRPLHGAG